MRQPLYIISACSISAQHTYDAETFLNPVVTSGNGQMYVIDPDYKKYINPVAIRRMSRMLKRGITAGMRCLDDAGIKTPDAIIVGTSRGSVTDMEIFLHELIELEENALNPAGFIQSTYNSVNGWLAMLTKCPSYNQTFVHRGFTLELCLFDAMLNLAETTETKHYLAGAFDELTPEYFYIRNKIDYYKKDLPDSFHLLEHSNTPGSVGGEGAHFFTVSNNKENAACALHALDMLHKPTAESLQQAVDAMLAQNGLTPDDIDILISGMNGDSRTRFLTDPVVASVSPRTTVAVFKHLCGEYDTASGFGLWLANYFFSKQSIPAEVVYKKGTSERIQNILFCNVTISGNATLMLLKGV